MLYSKKSNRLQQTNLNYLPPPWKWMKEWMNDKGKNAQSDNFIMF